MRRREFIASGGKAAESFDGEKGGIGKGVAGDPRRKRLTVPNKREKAVGGESLMRC